MPNKKVRKVLGKIGRGYFLEKEEKKVKNMKIYKNMFNDFCYKFEIRKTKNKILKKFRMPLLFQLNSPVMKS